MKKLFALLLTAIIFPATTLAAGNLKTALPNLRRSGTQAGTGEADLPTVIGAGINTALTMVGLIFMVLMVYAGYLWMTARGKEDEVDRAKRIITAAVIGLVIVMSAYAVTALVTGRFAAVG